MPLVDTRGFNFGLGATAEAQQFTQLLGQGQQVQARELALGQQRGQIDREAQIRQLLGQAGQSAPQTQQQQQLAAQSAGLGGEQVLGEQPRAAVPLEELKQLAKQISPEQSEKIFKSLGIDSDSQREEMSRFASRLQSLPENQISGEINARAQKLQADGRDPVNTLQLLDMTPEQRGRALIGVQLADLETKERFAVQQRATKGRAATLKAFAPITLVNKATGEKRLVAPTTDNLTGKAKLEPFSIPAGFEVSKETDEEKRTANVLAEGQKAAQKITAKGKAGRQQQSIDRGLDAAEGMANVQRGLDLLDKVATGGVDALSIRVKQTLGLEGADEAELSNRLSKAVLSQLKATFGAAFTAQEGAKLERIEAGLGKSTAGNKRILEQTKRIIIRSANRGIRAAEARGDTETARDIQEALDFRLDIEPTEEADQAIIRFNRQGQRIQ